MAEAARSRLSAGVLLYRRTADGTLEVLLAHPGGPHFVNRDHGHWTIPKGEALPGEDLEAVARREFQEETGQRLESELVPLGRILQKGGKTVVAWATEGDLDPETATSNTFQLQWPPGSGRFLEVPEIDRVAWFAPDEARRRIKDRQAPLIDRLETHLAISSRSPG